MIQTLLTILILMSTPKNKTDKAASAYFQQRMDLLGITPDTNKVGIWRNDPDHPGKNKIEEVPVFRDGEKGIDILVYSLDRAIVNYKPENSRWSKDYFLTRLEHPIVKKDGSLSSILCALVIVPMA